MSANRDREEEIFDTARELAADDERLGQAVRAGLNDILQVDPPLAAVAQQALERRQIVGDEVRIGIIIFSTTDVPPAQAGGQRTGGEEELVV